MKYNVFRFGWLIVLLVFSMALTGCIDVLHMVTVNKNSMSIQYRIALSKEMTNMQAGQEQRRAERRKKQRERQIKQREQAIQQGQNPPPLPPEKPVVKKKSPMENLGEGFSSFRKKNRKLLTRYKAGKIDSNAPETR